MDIINWDASYIAADITTLYIKRYSRNVAILEALFLAAKENCTDLKRRPYIGATLQASHSFL